MTIEWREEYTGSMRRRLKATFAILVALAVPAYADPANEASAKAKEAEALAKARKYEEAAVKFREAHRLDPRPEYQCNVGVAYQRAKRWPKAQIYLGECLLRGQAFDAKFISLLRTTLGTVEDTLRKEDYAPIDIVVDTGVAITIGGFDPDEIFVGSRVIWLPFGAHTITASAEGYDPQTREIDVQTRSQRQVRFELKKSKEMTSTMPAVPVPAVPAAAPPSKVPAIVVTGVAVGLGVGALATFVKARSVMKGAGSMEIDMNEYDEIIDDARRWQHISWGLAGAAGIGAIVSGYLWYRSTRSPSLEVTPATGGATVSVSGSF
jgi:tetratricopeptide (TPR) repeat protein